ncbi:branched-chain amino acid ABC transporter substrate-binding protein [Cellulomonas sp. URHD0024]|uniref:branched-chain amino acid ABC transporter substrate-binding protein n=1 Tax=Cellulomonas sp. URHD0024 TaxID=1302620 RepID=UPI0003FA272E|nr:branched-chain amino acid ABC transporter substrate-binding protein [Cellulomonas sp. URHD0024]
MRRSTPRLAGTALVLVVGLAVAGCSSKSSDDTGSSASSTGGTAALSIQPLVQIDNKGAEVKVDNSGTPANPAGDASAKCDPVTIAMAGALTGPNAALGINILNGATLAIDAHNAAAPDCQVAIKQFDTEGDPQKATQVAPTIVGDASIIGLLGPAFSGETKAVGPVFNQAGLLSLTASATNPDLTKNGWTNFFRGLANDAVQGPSVAAYMVNTLKYEKVCVVQDDSDYGVGLAEQITSGLGDAADSSCNAKVKTGDKQFDAAVQQVKDAEPDAVFYAGYYAEGAPFASQLKESGVTAAFVSADGTNDPQFVKQAGNAAKDAYLSCPCGPAPDQFATDYQAKFSTAPGVYSVEAYDLATIMLLGIDSGVKDRAGLIDWVKNYDGDGLARHYKWESTGELASALIWIYQVK